MPVTIETKGLPSTLFAGGSRLVVGVPTFSYRAVVEEVEDDDCVALYAAQMRAMALLDEDDD